jgi:hypothetical protein
MMASSIEIESARLSMLEAQKALQDYQDTKGFATSGELSRLTQAFAKATETYLTISSRKS